MREKKMFYRLILLLILPLFLVNLCGCAAVLVGAASGAGTAVWLSGKLSQQIDAPYEKVIKAAKAALKSLKLEIIKETKEERVAQLRSEYYDGQKIWIDIRKITDNSSKIEVRVGLLTNDKAAADKILRQINKSL